MEKGVSRPSWSRAGLQSLAEELWCIITPRHKHARNTKKSKAGDNLHFFMVVSPFQCKIYCSSIGCKKIVDTIFLLTSSLIIPINFVCFQNVEA